MNTDKLLEFSKVFHLRLGKDVNLCNDILDIIKDEIIKDIRIFYQSSFQLINEFFQQ